MLSLQFDNTKTKNKQTKTPVKEYKRDIPSTLTHTCQLSVFKVSVAQQGTTCFYLFLILSFQVSIYLNNDSVSKCKHKDKKYCQSFLPLIVNKEKRYKCDKKWKPPIIRLLINAILTVAKKDIDSQIASGKSLPESCLSQQSKTFYSSNCFHKQIIYGIMCF